MADTLANTVGLHGISQTFSW